MQGPKTKAVKGRSCLPCVFWEGLEKGQGSRRLKEERKSWGSQEEGPGQRERTCKGPEGQEEVGIAGGQDGGAKTRSRREVALEL